MSSTSSNVFIDSASAPIRIVTDAAANAHHAVTALIQATDAAVTASLQIPRSTVSDLESRLDHARIAHIKRILRATRLHLDAALADLDALTDWHDKVDDNSAQGWGDGNGWV